MSSSPSDPTLNAKLQQVWRVDAPVTPKPKEQPEKQEFKLNGSDQAQALVDHAQSEMAPAKLQVQIDAEAGRFVHTMRDKQTQEVLWRYPSENQLAYSRAVKAYLKAMSQG